MGGDQSRPSDPFSGEGKYTSRNFCQSLAQKYHYQWNDELDFWCDSVELDSTHQILVSTAAKIFNRIWEKEAAARRKQHEVKWLNEKLGNNMFQTALVAVDVDRLSALPSAWRNALVPRESAHGRVRGLLC